MPQPPCFGYKPLYLCQVDAETRRDAALAAGFPLSIWDAANLWDVDNTTYLRTCVARLSWFDFHCRRGGLVVGVVFWLRLLNRFRYDLIISYCYFLKIPPTAPLQWFPRLKQSVKFENLCNNFQMGGSVWIHLIVISFAPPFVQLEKTGVTR